MKKPEKDTKGLLSDVFKTKKETPRQIVMPEEEYRELLRTEVKQETNKRGRPSEKDPDKIYVRICARVPDELRDSMHVALHTTLKGKIHTLDKLIETAILEYLKQKPHHQDGSGE